MAEIFDFNVELLIRDVISQTDLTEENSNLRTAINDGIERNKMYRFLEHQKSKERGAAGLEPNPCFNLVCEHHVGSIKSPERFNYCDEEASCHGCLFQMITPPPNHLNYSEYMPSHKEALDMLEKNGLLKSDRSAYQDIFENYKKCKSQDQRKEVNLDGVTIFQAGRALENVLLSVKEYFEECVESSPVKPEEFINEELKIIRRNFEVELEKVLGIFPNIRLVSDQD